MKILSCFILSIVFCARLFAQTQTKAEVLNNKLIIDLCKAGLSAQTIISKIESSTGKYDLSTTALINLKNQKVPDDVIDALVRKSDSGAAASAQVQSTSLKSSSGVQPLQPSAAAIPDLEFINVIHSYNKSLNKLTMLERSTVAVKAKVNLLKAMVPGTSIPIIFKMDGDKSPARAAVITATSFMVNSGINTPEIFGLYRMQVKKGKREATWFNVSAFENKSDKDVVAFNYRKVKDGIYEIVPVNKLEAGEYCFVNKTSYTTYGGSKADVFAFGVD